MKFVYKLTVVAVLILCLFKCGAQGLDDCALGQPNAYQSSSNMWSNPNDLWHIDQDFRGDTLYNGSFSNWNLAILHRALQARNRCLARGGACGTCPTEECYPRINTDTLSACSPLSIGVTNTGDYIEAIYIDTTANVGVGTNLPNGKLHSKGGKVIFESDSSGVQQIDSLYNGNVTRYYVTKTLTYEEVKLLNSVPISIGLPASGAGYFYRVISAQAYIDYDSEAYEQIYLFIGATSTLPFRQLSSLVSLDLFTFSGFSGFALVNGTLIEHNGFAPNDSISISATADSETGDSEITLYMQIEKVKM